MTCVHKDNLCPCFKYVFALIFNHKIKIYLKLCCFDQNITLSFNWIYGVTTMSIFLESPFFEPLNSIFKKNLYLKTANFQSKNLQISEQKIIFIIRRTQMLFQFMLLVIIDVQCRYIICMLMVFNCINVG